MRNFLTGLLITLAGAASAQDAERGREVFVIHCATCHGLAATGGGPLTEILTVVPPDLTTLSARNGGVFPALQVVARIDGEAEVLAHGGPMPLFGRILEGPAGIVLAPDGAEVIAPERIVDVVAWLAGVQR